MKLLSAICFSFLLASTVLGQSLPALKVGPDNRSLVTENNKAFFWLADTGWELFHRLTKQEADTYLKTRAAQGFTVVQAVVLAELDGLHKPNAEGHLPFTDGDPDKPNEAYFKHVDWVISKAASYKLYVALLPTWGDKLFKASWGKGPEIFNEATAASYGSWIGKRYKNYSNIIWVIGGDRTPRNDSDVAVWRTMATAINRSAGGNHKTLMTFHPQPSETSSSSPWFHKEPWLDFNMLQTGHCRDVDVWNKVQGDYALSPIKPVLNGEPVYEAHPVCFNAKDFGYTDAYDVRKAAYLSVFAGSFGFSYGCHAVWQFFAPGREPVNAPLKPWNESLQLPGANQMRYLRQLMTEFPIIGLVPDQTMIVDPRDSTERIQAIRGKNFLLVYSAAGKAFKLKPGKITGTSLQGYWYDPRTGSKQPVAAVSNKDELEYRPPTEGRDNDWVLVLKGN